MFHYSLQNIKLSKRESCSALKKCFFLSKLNHFAAKSHFKKMMHQDAFILKLYFKI